MARLIKLDNGKSILTSECFDKEGKRGRPKLVLNDLGKEIITKLAGVMATEEEIAGFLDVTVETLHSKSNYNIFLECYKKGQKLGKISLRQAQFKLAQKNPAMAIWLGKQHLGQKEIPETTDEDDVIIFKNDIPKVD
jgi:hypothetical protein